MTTSAPTMTADALRVAEAWLVQFQIALTSGNEAAIGALFAEDAFWRDVLAFTWTIEQHNGRHGIAATLARCCAATSPSNVRILPRRTQPRLVHRAGREVIEALFAFDTRVGQASGVVRLVPDTQAPSGFSAWVVATSLEDVSRVSRGHVRSTAESRTFGGDNWLDRRKAQLAFADRPPACVVIGAGQAGVAIAARLRALDVDTLVIDRHERLGDNWRKRYHALTLHNEVFVNHFPFLPFPETWPVFIPKDQLANWFEVYAEAMELNVWSGTALKAGSYDNRTGRWRLILGGQDGERVVEPRHVVFATGVSSIPYRSKLPGLEAFRGTTMHSGQYQSGEAWRGRRAIVVGTGTSAHDVAQDLHASGAHVTMIQRSPTYVVSLKQAQGVYAIYNEGPSVDDCDLITTATSYELMWRSYQMSTAAMKRADQPLLDRLAARGFKLNDGGADATGFQMQYLRRGGGYYFDVGCSSLIADGAIDLVQWADVECFDAQGMCMKSGAMRPADLIVAATGYLNQQDTVRAYLGDDIADRIGPVWGFDDGGELANMWKRTPQPGLWFTAGSLAQSRIYSKFLALQIKAAELGLIDKVAPPIPAHGFVAHEAAIAASLKH